MKKQHGMNVMTVKEAIRALKQMPQDAVIVHYTDVTTVISNITYDEKNKVVSIEDDYVSLQYYQQGW